MFRGLEGLRQHTLYLLETVAGLITLINELYPFPFKTISVAFELGSN